MTTQIFDILVPAHPLSSLNFMFTEKCNLKCVYCPQYSDKRPMQHTSPQVLSAIIAYIIKNSIVSAGVGFYGETLCFEGWDQYAKELIEAGVGMSICSNWNHKLTDDEVNVLSKFKFIQFSIDTTNQELLRSIRPPADLRLFCTICILFVAELFLTIVLCQYLCGVAYLVTKSFHTCLILWRWQFQCCF